MQKFYKLSKRTVNSSVLMLLWMVFSNALLSAEKLLVDEIVEGAMPAVVQITVYDSAGSEIGNGSGFFVAPGRVLTCAHVIEDAYSAKVISKTMQYCQVKILNIDEDLDLALLKVNAFDEHYLQLEEELPIQNEYVIAIGSKGSEGERTASYGLVTRRESQGILSSTYATEGWSGGPLMNLEGHVIGIHMGAKRYSIAIDTDKIKKFLKRPHNNQELAKAESSVLWKMVLKKIINIHEAIFGFIYFHWWLGIFIIILIASLIGWVVKSLYKYRLIKEPKKPI